MNKAAEEQVEKPHVLHTLYAPIEAGLHQVDEVFTFLRSKYPFVDDLVKYGFRLAASDCGRPYYC